MALPKLLPTITIPSRWTVAWERGAGTKTATLTAGTYDSILEVLAMLDTVMTAVDGAWTMAVSANGIVSITEAGGAWSFVWASMTDALEQLLGLAGTETHTAGVITATYRHLYGWYAPVGWQGPEDVREIRAREQETDAGGMSQIASTVTHRYREATFGLLTRPQLSEGGSDSDGKGGTVTWTSRTLFYFWQYTRDRPFRWYDDCASGTVASPGSEGTEFVTCRRMGTRFEPIQREAGDFSYFDFTLRMKVTGE